MTTTTSAERSNGAVRDPIWLFSKAVLLPILYGPLRMRRAGMGNLPRSGTVLLVCNHVSVVDPVALTVAARPRRVRMMAMVELFRIPVLGAYVRRMGAFPVMRDSADHGAMRTARQLLAEGECVVVFPEGRVSRGGIMRPGSPGVGALALLPGVTVVPAAVWNTQLMRGPVRVGFGPPVDLSGLPDGGPRSARARAATERIMAALAELVPQVGGPAQPAPGCTPTAAERAASV